MVVRLSTSELRPPVFGWSVCLSSFLFPTPPSLAVGDRQNSSTQLQPQPQPVHTDTANGNSLSAGRGGVEGGADLARWWLCAFSSNNLQAFPGPPSGWGEEWQERRLCSQQGDCTGWTGKAV